MAISFYDIENIAIKVEIKYLIENIASKIIIKHLIEKCNKYRKVR